VKAIESLHGGEIVDVKTENLVAHLTEHGVVKLEEAELHTILMRVCHGTDCSSLVGGIVLALKLSEHVLGSLHYALRHTGKARNMYAKRVL
jgi:hypothetical protein